MDEGRGYSYLDGTEEYEECLVLQCDRYREKHGKMDGMVPISNLLGIILTD